MNGRDQKRKKMETKKTGEKWVLIGPVYPYKGGISHYTGLMYAALSKAHDVEMISYKMQYPRFLFKKEQRDYSNDTFKVEKTRFLINTANPFNILRTGSEIIKMKPSKVIIQWWHPYFAPCYRILTGMLKRAGIEITYICHNVFPHERFPMDKRLTAMALRPADRYILHARGEVPDLLKIKPDADYKVQVHPTYSAFNFNNMGRDEAREKLSIDKNENVMLFFGFVREYKGLKHLLNAVAILKEKYYHDGSGMPKLYVVGDFDGNKDEYEKKIEELKITNDIIIKDGYVPDREVEKYFAASDLVVLPYESATQSGIVQIAYGFRKPVIVTRVGGLPEVVEDGITGVIVEPFDDNALAKAIYDYFVFNRQEEYTQGIIEREYRFSWDRMTEALG
jgi:glycosyltransferase involved in cell wall biosynthesis